MTYIPFAGQLFIVAIAVLAAIGACAIYTAGPTDLEDF